MEAKAIEIRDSATFIPAIAILMHSGEPTEHYLLRRAGFACERRPGRDDILLCRMDASGVHRNATADPFAWGGRTFPTAHEWICRHWDEIKTGDVLDVEFILGESQAPKLSEREA